MVYICCPVKLTSDLVKVLFRDRPLGKINLDSCFRLRKLHHNLLQHIFRLYVDLAFASVLLALQVLRTVAHEAILRVERVLGRLLYNVIIVVGVPLGLLLA